MSEMTVKELEHVIKRYRENGEIQTAYRFIESYRKLEGFNYTKALNELTEYEKKQAQK